MSLAQPPLSLLLPPYARLQPTEADISSLRTYGRRPGVALVWRMGGADDEARGQAVQGRPGGLSLLVVLPPERDLRSSPSLALLLHRLRPQGILPHHPDPAASDLAQVLRRPPADLSGEVVDYLRWRGFALDRETTQLLRRIIDLSGELRSIASVSRSLYVSRRALGRRLTTRGLPVPSHWLQMGRLLRVAVRLQNSDATVSSVAFEHGYPDGFALSNQMERLMGFRPSDVRRHLGWEWLVEGWLRREAESGKLRTVCPSPAESADPVSPLAMGRPPQPARSRGREGAHSGG